MKTRVHAKKRASVSKKNVSGGVPRDAAVRVLFEQLNAAVFPPVGRVLQWGGKPVACGTITQRERAVAALGLARALAPDEPSFLAAMTDAVVAYPDMWQDGRPEKAPSVEMAVAAIFQLDPDAAEVIALVDKLNGWKHREGWIVSLMRAARFLATAEIHLYSALCQAATMTPWWLMKRANDESTSPKPPAKRTRKAKQ